MALDWNGLADEIAAVMGYSPTTDQIKGFAHGTVDEIKLGVATFGTIPSPHVISGLVDSRMAGFIMGYTGYPSITVQLLGYCTGVVTHVMSAGIVTYSGPPLAPPAEPIGWYLGGTISGLDGAACAVLVAAAAGYPSVSPKLEAECTAVCNHIMTNAQVEMGVIS